MHLVIDILRHGAAEAGGTHGDAGRPLSLSGTRAIARLGERLALGGWRPARVFASPLRRAQETARLVLQPLTPTPVIESASELLPEGVPAEVIEMLESHDATSGTILIVSHMPLAAELLTYLTGEAVGFAPGDLRRIECRTSLARGSGHAARVPGATC